MLDTRAIYRSRYVHYIALLGVSKLCRSFGIFLSYDILKLIHLVQFLFFIKAGAAVFLVFLQKPFTSGKHISKHQWLRIFRHAFFGTVINLLWLFGLTLCGPLRTLLLFEHSDMVIIAGAGALFTSSSSPSKFRGAVFFILAVMGILLFDHDDVMEHLNEHPEVHRESHNGVLSHLFDHLTNLTGLSDHKGGVVLLFFTLSLQVGFKSASKKLSVDIGGSKRLHALSTIVSAIFLFPWSTMLYFTQESQVISWQSVVIPVVLVILLVFVADYYIEAACVSRLELPITNRLGAFATFGSALLFSCFWNHPFVSQMTTMRHLKEIIAEDHVLSGGVVFSFFLFIFATNILTNQTRGGNRGSFVGYSATGLPLYNFTSEKLTKTSNSLILLAKHGLRSILEDSDSRKIFYFLCINLFFTFVELIYGVWTNSLGLISDGFHMLFDCSALVMGLYAAVMSRWKATRIFSYGFDRVEVLSGFINGLFLVVIAFFVFTAAVTRLFDPPEINTERLLAVSVIGFFVNLIGIFAFSHGHSHGGGGHGHSHGTSSGGSSHHGHSHSGGASHAHSHSHGHSVSTASSPSSGHSHATHNTNMQGVYLHVLADTMGSVGVIVSTLIIENFGYQIADPICSIFIAVLIFLSVLPLVKETALTLLLQTPDDCLDNVKHALQKVLALDGVLSYRNEHIWRHSSKCLAATLQVQVKPSVSEQIVVPQITSIFKEAGVNNLTVQIEKEAYFNHMAGFGIRQADMFQMRETFEAMNYQSSSYMKGL